MTPYDLTEDELKLRGGLFFHCLETKTAEATAAAAGLGKRGYVLKPAAGKADPHGEGKALYAAFCAAETARTDAGTERASGVDAAESQAGALRTWTRELHAEIIGIRRRQGSAAILKSLSTLGELASQPGLQSSAADLVAFVSNTAVQHALAPFQIGADDAKAGQKLLDDWTKALGGATATRGGETTKTLTHIDKREAFRAWLAQWWAIAKVRFKDQPGVLRALGVETASKKARAKVQVVKVTEPA